MSIEIQINNKVTPKARYLTWSPSPCRIRMTNPGAILLPQVQVRLISRTQARGGSIEFATNVAGPYASSLTINLLRTGQSAPFFVRGVYGQASKSDGDVQIEAQIGTRTGVLTRWKKAASFPVMVRIRKNAEKLTSGERDRVVRAFAQLNDRGLGRFTDFREMHVGPSLEEAHGAAGFLPWHRAYLLDLERELQLIDSSVALPYWRFDEPAPGLFTHDFLGASTSIGRVQFSATNPLQFWRTDDGLGISRRPGFPINQAPSGLRTEAETLSLGAQFQTFRIMERNPHGRAHTSFGGSISEAETAARDPLFFLLHCNVDRLWAKWQHQNNLFDANLPDAYDRGNPSNRIGHNLPDTMWPWNGVTTTPRPSIAPGGALASSPCVSAPGPQPRVQDCFDYRGSVDPLARMDFDYDDAR